MSGARQDRGSGWTWGGAKAGVAAGLALTLAWTAGCARSEPQVAAAELPVVRVSTVVAVKESLPVTTEATGTVRAVQRAEVAAKVMGTIEELPVRLGQRVKRGEVVARIAAAEIGARVRQAQTALAGLRRDLERERGLAEKGAGTRETVATLQDRIATAEAVLKEAEAMQAYTTVRAPFDGAVARRIADAGDVAAPGMPLLEIEGTDDFEIEAEVPESALAGVSVGGAVAVAVPAAGAEFPARVKEIAAAADARSRSVLVTLAVPKGTAVRSGQFARVAVPGPSAPTVLVPVAAVATIGQIERVFVADAAGRAVLRIVKTGGRRGDRIEVLAGLTAGERVVVAPPADLTDGRRVEAAP